MRQLELLAPRGLCDYWRHVTNVACGVMHKDPRSVGWSGPLCAKCDELRSWLRGYLSKAGDD
jgi:hypothetical protein